MNLIPNLLPEALVRALGWTLLHSLWQTAFVALCLGLLLLLLRHHTSRLRYAVAGGAMLAQLLLSGGTFAYYYARTATSVTLAASTGVASINMAGAATQSAAAPFWQDPLGVARVYFDQHLPLLVTCWLLGLLLMAVRFIGGVAYTQRLRHYKVTPLPAEWQNRLQALSQRIGLARQVRLVESALVQVPVAIGLAKPVILLPIGAVTGLSPKQVEAILAHELAHIMRKDYLLNLLQSVVDLLFFYHPAMWWISDVVRAERENCCDDVAVAVCGDTMTYARALAELEARRLPAAPAMAMAFSGKRGSLLGRIRRLVGQQSLKPTFSEGFLAAIVLVVGLLGLSFGAVAGLHTTPKQPKAAVQELLLEQPARVITTLARNPAAVAPEATPDSAAEETTNAYVYKVQGPTGGQQDVIIIKNKKGKVTELYVNGKRIPKKDIPKFDALINQRLQAVDHAPKAREEEVERSIEIARSATANVRRRDRENFNYNYNFRFDGDSLAPLPPVPPMPPMPAIAPMPPMPPMPPALFQDYDKKADKLSKKEQKERDAAMKAYEKEIKAYEAEVRNRYKDVDVQRITRQAELQVARAQRQAEMAHQHAQIAQQHAAVARQRADRMQTVKEELVKDGLIKDDTSNLSIQLNEDGFYVNGKKQPDKVYEKYKKLLQPDGDVKGKFNLQYNEN